MSAILQGYNPVGIERVKSEEARELYKLLSFQKELNAQISFSLQKLNEEGESNDVRNESFEIIKEMYSIPDTITVKDAAKIMGVSPQRVRSLCAKGDLEAVQTMEGSGKWRIEPKQLMKYPGWAEYTEKRQELGIQSKNIVEFMRENLGALNE